MVKWQSGKGKKTQAGTAWKDEKKKSLPHPHGGRPGEGKKQQGHHQIAIKLARWRYCEFPRDLLLNQAATRGSSSFGHVVSQLTCQCIGHVPGSDDIHLIYMIPAYNRFMLHNTCYPPNKTRFLPKNLNLFIGRLCANCHWNVSVERQSYQPQLTTLVACSKAVRCPCGSNVPKTLDEPALWLDG